MPDKEALEVESAPLPDEVPAEPEKQETEEASPEAVEDKEVEAEDTEETSEETSDGDDEAEDKPKKKDRVQKRIDRLTADKRAAERRVQELERAALERALPAPEPTTPLKEADFESYGDFLVAKATQEAERKVTAKFQEQHQKQQADQQRSRQSEMANEFQARADDARDKYEDFDDVAFDPSTPVTPHMMQVILESDAGPELAYHLGSNHREAQRISLLSPLAQARELGKIEAKLVDPPKKQTKAPDPPKKLKGKATAKKDPSNMSYEEYRKFRGS